MTLIEHRRDLGWTQEHLAQTSGISVRAIQRLENAQLRAQIVYKASRQPLGAT